MRKSKGKAPRQEREKQTGENTKAEKAKAGKADAKIEAGRVWEEVEEQFVPKTGARMGERVVYFYLLRTVRMAGRRTALVTIGELAKAVCLCKTVVRTAVRWLARVRAVRILGRGRAGHRIEVRCPAEIPGCVGDASRVSKGVTGIHDWYSQRAGRRAIFEREGHRCFYCLRHLGTRTRTLDHVVPLVRGGWNGYRNVVACCPACNEMKKASSAEDLLRRLHRQGLLGRREFFRRMTALRELRRGVLRPRMAA